ncbi:MAG: sulfatase-like hydrolase/transferase, partial [Verrucomicrobiia bacterium]
MKPLILIIALTTVIPLTARDRPNILHIIADDMGYSDIGCYGSEIETPNLDALAERGVRFTNYYVNNMCWPTRASLLTGLYPKTALPAGGSHRGGLHPEAVTLPQALKSVGYTT